MRPARSIAIALAFSFVALSVTHAQAAKSKPSASAAPFSTYHLNGMYVVTITKKAVVNPASDSSDASGHKYLTLFLSMRNRNDVIVKFDPSVFTLTDELDQPAQSVDECRSYPSSIASETTRLARQFQPRLCSNSYANSNYFVAPGKPVNGSIAFSVPTGQHRAKLTWAPTGAMDSSITWPPQTWTIFY